LTAISLVVIGLAGIILPILPGVPVLWLGLVWMAWLGDFETVGFWTLFWLGALAALSVVVDFIATAEGARRFGAGRLAIIGATLGLLFGIFLGPVGIFLGPFIGAVLGHLIGKSSIDASMRAGVGATVGVVAGTLAKGLIALVMLVWFGFAWWL
ncbi:MAG TPA: DUF456 domain-containing protein, partial [Wenzhouxiangella sp.]